MSDSELQIGQQSQAARFVHQSAQPMQEVLSDLGTALQQDFDGFRGGAAAETVKAVEAWFEGAKQLFTVMEEYSQRLVEVDRTAAATELTTQQGFARFAGRLGGE